MNPIGAAFYLVGAAIAVLAGVGLLRFHTPYARFHSAGKASPIAFIAVGIGAATELGWAGAIELAVAAAAMTLTLPVGVHLLFRATHRTTPGDHLVIDELADAEARSAEAASEEQ